MEELEETVTKINLLLKTTKHRQTTKDFKLIKLLACASFVSFLLAVFLGVFINFGLAIAFAVILAGLVFYMLHRSSTLTHEGGSENNLLLQA